MTHPLTLELPDEIYQPLVQRAQVTGQTVEAAAKDCLSQALTPRAGYGRLRRWAGALASGVADAGVRHDDYLGQALYDELNEPRHA